MSNNDLSSREINPLQSIEQWEDDVLTRYPVAGETAKKKEEFRNYDNPERDTVREFYRLNHKYQTYDFVLEKEKDFLRFNRKELKVWDAMEYFEANPDSRDPRYNTKYGVYSPNCGLRNVHMSWGHDEYLYQIMKDYLPEPALYMIRYHSFYAQHREHAYDHLMDAHDHEMFKWVDKFNPYDLYSKSPKPPVVSELKPYYEELIAKYLPATIRL